MKKTITFIFCGFGVILSIVVLIMGYSYSLNSEISTGLSFWNSFSIFVLASVVILFATAVFAVILIGICQITDNLREINIHVSNMDNCNKNKGD